MDIHRSLSGLATAAVLSLGIIPVTPAAASTQDSIITMTIGDTGSSGVIVMSPVIAGITGITWDPWQPQQQDSYQWQQGTYQQQDPYQQQGTYQQQGGTSQQQGTYQQQQPQQDSSQQQKSAKQQKSQQQDSSQQQKSAKQQKSQQQGTSQQQQSQQGTSQQQGTSKQQKSAKQQKSQQGTSQQQGTYQQQGGTSQQQGTYQQQGGTYQQQGGTSDSDVKLNIVTINGSGCPLGTAAIALSPDREAVTITYSQYTVELGVGTYKNCQLNLAMLVPSGKTYTIASADYRGFAKLDSGVNGEFHGTYYFSGDNGSSYTTHTLPGPMDRSWQFTDTVSSASEVWHPCGAQRNLNINTRLGVSGSTNAKEGLISMNSTDVEFSTRYELKWKDC